MCGPKGFGFSAVLVKNAVSIWPCFLYFCFELGMFFSRSYFFVCFSSLSIRPKNKSTSAVRATVSAATVKNRVLNFSSGHKQGRKKSQILVVNRENVLRREPHTCQDRGMLRHSVIWALSDERLYFISTRSSPEKLNSVSCHVVYNRYCAKKRDMYHLRNWNED